MTVFVYVNTSKQVGDPDPAVHIADEGVAGAEADDPLLERDYLLDRPGVQLALGESG